MKTKIYPEIGFLRLRDVIGGKDNPGIIPVSRSSRAEGIAEYKNLIVLNMPYTDLVTTEG